MEGNKIADIRKDYRLAELLESDVAADGMEQFERWWKEALAAEVEEVNAMTLATVGENGEPDARIVLLKGYDERGFIFFTNYASVKGQQMESNPRGTLLFFWKELERQVRILGVVERVPEEESDQYFQSRPAGSRIGAWASPQSQVIPDRGLLEKKVLQLEEQYAGDDVTIPRPSHWGGYVIKPYRMEFWQGRPNRLHDRLQYTLEGDSWIIERLAP
jgi:pyridoxamine 5'-phosphate oxidase